MSARKSSVTFSNLGKSLKVKKTGNLAHTPIILTITNMNKELQSIFVPLKVAKLAKEKGFKGWCAAYKESKYTESANVRGDLGWYYGKRENGKNIVHIPTHYQLISWLKNKYNIDVQMQCNGLFDVVDNVGQLQYNDKEETEFEINEALEVGLNLIQSNTKQSNEV